MASALGLVTHTGWAWVVHVVGERAPDVAARERVVAVPVLDAELYHRSRDHDGDRVRFFAEQRAAARERTVAALRAVIGDATAAIVLGKSPAVPALDAVVRSHAMIHTAEGDLWRALFAEACAACGVAARREPADPVRAAVEARLGKPAVDAWLAAAGKALGSPWTQEIKDAALAARHALASRSV